MTRTRHASRAQSRRVTYAALLGLAAVLVLVAAIIVVMPSSGTARSAPVLGVYAGTGDPAAVSDFAAALGTQPRYAMDFIYGQTWSTITQSGSPYSSWQGTGYTMIWGVDMLPNTYSPNSDPSVAGGSCYGLTQGATGEFDHYFVTVAKNIVNAGFANSIIRLGWEFNGGWFPWAAHGCASAFVDLLRQHCYQHALSPGGALHLRVEPDPRGSGCWRPGRLLPR